MSSDIIELLDTSIDSENWKTVEVFEFLHKMIQKFWKEEKVPEKFKEIIIRPFINADRDPTDPSNYRPLALLNVLTKVNEHIIKERLAKYLERIKFLSSAQAAYRKGRSTVDNILIIQEVLYYYRYKKGSQRIMKEKTPLMLAFVDLVKAFDTVPREKLFRKLSQAGVKGKMYRATKDLYSENRAK